MKKVIKVNGASEAYSAGAWIYQDMNEIGGRVATDDLIDELAVREGEILTSSEVDTVYGMTSNPEYGEYISGLLNGSIEDDEYGIIQPLLDFLHQKRVFVFVDNEGIKRVIGIPAEREIGTGLCAFTKDLLNCALRYKSYSESDDKTASWKSFSGAVFGLQKRIVQRLFSKKFKEKLDFSFNGISGVALTGNVSLSGIQLPKWYCKKHGLKIGDLVVVTRDPIQNIFVTLKIEGYTRNEIRVNSHMFTFLGGDFDGDRIHVVPFVAIMEELRDRGFDDFTISTILYELTGLLPKHLFNNPKFARLIRDYEWIEPVYVTSISFDDLEKEFFLSSKGKMLSGAPLNNRIQKYANDNGITVIKGDKEFKPM